MTSRKLCHAALTGREVEYQDSPIEHRSDLVLIAEEGDTIVVEVELGDPQDNSVFQIRQYMKATDATLGVLITAPPSNPFLEELVADALDDMQPSQSTLWLQYEVGLRPVTSRPS